MLLGSTVFSKGMPAIWPASERFVKKRLENVKLFPDMNVAVKRPSGNCRQNTGYIMRKAVNDSWKVDVASPVKVTLWWRRCALFLGILEGGCNDQIVIAWDAIEGSNYLGLSRMGGKFFASTTPWRVNTTSSLVRVRLTSLQEEGLSVKESPYVFCQATIYNLQWVKCSIWWYRLCLLSQMSEGILFLLRHISEPRPEPGLRWGQSDEPYAILIQLTGSRNIVGDIHGVY